MPENQIYTKAVVEKLKEDTSAFQEFIRSENSKSIKYVLERMGRLRNGLSSKPFLDLLDSNNDEIRFLAIKNLAKLGNPTLIDVLLKTAKGDSSTIVRRESVSALGRMRSERTILAPFGSSTF